MRKKFILPLLALTFTLAANASVNTLGQKSLDSFVTFFEEENIFVTTENAHPKDIQTFLNEFRKFPNELHQEMMRQGGKIHLIHGESVIDDPSWLQEHSNTFDGRAWKQVPGAGGFPYYGTPTRLVVNHLNNKTRHGSSNLFLHEHAHSLDSTYSYHGISSSNTWKKLMRQNPQVEGYLNTKCVNRYCTDNEPERFAELFSLYFHSEETRQEMERVVPKIADFFKNLNVRTIKNMR
ncbi:MAG: hypothetical protein WDA09_02665 [Bacteriovoracaceae bacterium]